MAKIIEAQIQESNSRYGDLEFFAKLDNGFTGMVFAWFSDELKFAPSDVIGLTVEEARDLKQARDLAFLQS